MSVDRDATVDSFSTDPYTKWADEENIATLQRWEPLRNALVVSTDPFESVIFSDIDSFLFQIKTRKGKNLLMTCFYSFLGLKLQVNLQPSNSFLFQDPFLHHEFENDKMASKFLNKRKDGESNTIIPISFPIYFYPSPVSGLFGDNTTFPSTFTDSDFEILKGRGVGYLEFCCRVLEQSINLSKDSGLYHLWIQSISDPKQAEKNAKKMLKSQPMNLELWNVYAQLVLKLKGVNEVCASC